MRITVRASSRWLTRRARRRFAFALRRFEDRVRSLVVRVTDVNGPRGGIDKRCRVTVQLQGPSRTVVIDDVMRMPPLPWTVQPTAPRAPSHEPSRPHPGGELFSAPDRVLWRVVRRGRVSQRKGLSL